MYIVAQREGGSDASWNLLPGCGCNQNMRHMNLVDWMGTRGNKQGLLRSVFLPKYKSLVPPCRRSSHDPLQLARWVRETYAPLQIDTYAEWLTLLEKDLGQIHEDANPAKPVESKIAQRRVSPYFARPYVHSEIGRRLRQSNIHPSYDRRRDACVHK